MANFIQLVEDTYRGGLAAELSEKLTEVVRACEKTGKQGNITLQFKVKARGNSGEMLISPVVKSSVPEHDKGEAIMFSTPEGNLQLQDPRQGDLDLKTIDSKQREEPRVVPLKKAQGA